jgi:hypothetical protein
VICRRDGDRYIVFLGDDRIGFVRRADNGTWNNVDTTMAHSGYAKTRERAGQLFLRARALGAPEISSDGFPAYPDAVERAFGIDCTFGTIEKHYAVETAAVEAARRDDVEIRDGKPTTSVVVTDTTAAGE